MNWWDRGKHHPHDPWYLSTHMVWAVPVAIWIAGAIYVAACLLWAPELLPHKHCR